MKWYTKSHFMTEIKTAVKLLSFGKELFHFLYGEDDYYYLGFFPKNKNKRIICTYHQPPEYFEQFVGKKNHLKKLDALVVVSKVQLEYFEKIVGKGRVFFIPHGVDTDFFKPGRLNLAKYTNKYNCIFVGQWLRDFTMLKNVIQIVCSRRKNINFHLIINRKHKPFFSNLPNTYSYSGIDDFTLLNFYQNTALLVIPLISCTANNAILESLACGVPVITTDVGGVSNYLDRNCGILVKQGKADIMADEVIALIDDKSKRAAMSENARKKALGFSWPLIAKGTTDVYSNLFM